MAAVAFDVIKIIRATSSFFRTYSFYFRQFYNISIFVDGQKLSYNEPKLDDVLFYTHIENII